MDNKIFDGMVVFCSVIEHGTFTAAAKALNHTTSHVSKEVARLEDRLGTRLMNRTTRKISLTESGCIFYENSSRIIDDAESIHSQILTTQDRPYGHLKVSVPVMFGDTCLNQWLPEFIAEFPDITHDVQVSDRVVDIIADGFDVVVRAGQLENAEFIAKRLMTTRQLTVASPDYLNIHGEPTTPDDLEGHSLVDFTYRGISNIWEYQTSTGKTVTVKVKPKIRCNSPSMEIALASSGFGITRIPQLAAAQQLNAGKLVPILVDFENDELEFHAVYPSRRHLAPKVRVYVDFLARKCGERI
jgi:DNA-binding transcriptional LysR family regulator